MQVADHLHALTQICSPSSLHHEPGDFTSGAQVIAIPRLQEVNILIPWPARHRRTRRSVLVQLILHEILAQTLVHSAVAIIFMFALPLGTRSDLFSYEILRDGFVRALVFAELSPRTPIIHF